MVDGGAPAVPPDWSTVEALLARLASTRVRFATATTSAAWISSYEPGRRLRLETGQGSRWVEVESIRICWTRLEHLGRIRRNDVLDPGRCSAFMMALFEQVAGVTEEAGDDPYLVRAGGLGDRRGRAGRPRAQPAPHPTAS